MSIASWRRQLRGALIEWKDAGADADEVVDLIEGLISLKVDEMLQAKKDTAPETGAAKKPRNLESLCDRLGEVFNADDDTPDELSVESREAIEELWEERDRLRAALTQIEKNSDANSAYVTPDRLSEIARAALNRGD